jgi:hypothetical protein
MKRAILAGLLALVTWTLVASIINRVFRLVIPGYTAAEHTLQFTLSIEIARLLMGAAASVAGGVVASWIAPTKSWVAPVVGIIVLALFLPVHIAIWAKLPVWYHLTFLLTIIPLVVLGARLAPRRADRLPSPLVPSRS